MAVSTRRYRSITKLLRSCNKGNFEEVGIEENKLKFIKENDRWINYDVPKEKFLNIFLKK